MPGSQVRACVGKVSIMARPKTGCFAPGNRGGHFGGNLVFISATIPIATAFAVAARLRRHHRHHRYLFHFRRLELEDALRKRQPFQHSFCFLPAFSSGFSFSFGSISFGFSCSLVLCRSLQTAFESGFFCRTWEAGEDWVCFAQVAGEELWKYGVFQPPHMSGRKPHGDVDVWC